MKGIARSSLEKKVTQIEKEEDKNKISFERTKEIGFLLEKNLNYNTLFQFNVWSLKVLDYYNIIDSKTSFDNGEKVFILAGISFTPLPLQEALKV